LASKTDDLVQESLEADVEALQDFMPRFKALVPLTEACTSHVGKPASSQVIACVSASDVGTDIIDWMIKGAKMVNYDEAMVRVATDHVQFDLLPEYDEAMGTCFG
jgi:hypothetical protein